MLEPYRTTVVPEWIDYNDHLTEGFYAVIFGDASDNLLTQIGFGADYRDQQRGTFYTVETHVRFLRELKLGDQLEVHMRIIGVDEKRLHFWHELMHAEEGFIAATQEAMLLHVDLDEIRVRPMDPAIQRAAYDAWDADADMPLPAKLGAAVEPIDETEAPG